MSRKSWFGGLLALALVAGGANGAVAEAPKLTLAVPGIPPVFQTVLAYVADKEGFFKKYGVDVTVRAFATGVAAARAVAAGEIDMTISPTPVVINMVSNAGIKLVGVYGLENPDWLIGSTDTELGTCADLGGKLIGVDAVGGARAVALTEMIASCGLKPDQVQLVGLSSNVGPAMVAGQIKVGVLHIDDVPTIETQLGRKLTIVTTMKKVSPINHYNLFAVRADKLKAERDAFVRMLAAFIDAGDFIRDPKNLDKVAEIATVTGRTAAEAKNVLPQFIAIDFWPNGDNGLSREKIARVTEGQVKLGGIKEGKTPVPYDQLVDPSLWPEAVALTKKK
jgi:NitT/TauT family transport system substrate-binding protein